MVRVEAAHRFEVPVDQGFAYITDMKNWPKFWPGFVRLDSASGWGPTRRHGPTRDEPARP